MNNHLIFKYMDTFDIYKSYYINARLRYTNAKDMCQLLKEEIESNHKHRDRRLLDRYDQEKWEAETNVLNSADMMGDYIAKCAMAKIDDDDLTCLITSGNMMSECAETYFEFDFRFMPMPTLERLMESNPVLNDLCDQMYYGKVDAFEAKKEMEEEGAKCGEVTMISGYSEIDIMRPPFEELVDEIADLAWAAIDGFRSDSRS